MPITAQLYHVLYDEQLQAWAAFVASADCMTYVITNEGERLVTKRYESKIKPEKIHLASPKALEVNGYSDEEWVDAPIAKEVLPDVCEAISKSSL